MANFHNALEKRIGDFGQQIGRTTMTIEEYVDRIGILAISKQFYESPGTASMEQACVSWNNLANRFNTQEKKIDQQFLMLRTNWSGEAASSTLNDISMYLSWLGTNYKKITHTTSIIWEYTQLFNAIRNMIVKPEIVERNRLDLVYYKENLTVLQTANLLGSNEAAIFQCKNYILSLEQEYTTWCTSTSYVLKQYAANMAALLSRLYPFAVLAPIV